MAAKAVVTNDTKSPTRVSQVEKSVGELQLATDRLSQATEKLHERLQIVLTPFVADNVPGENKKADEFVPLALEIKDQVYRLNGLASSLESILYRLEL